MIKIDGTKQLYIHNPQVFGFEESIHAAGYAMATDIETFTTDLETGSKRFARLGKTEVSSGHPNFLKGIIVQFDITTNQQVFQQLLRYVFVVPVSSTSKMHKGASMVRRYDPYTPDECIEVVDKYTRLLYEAEERYAENRTVENRLARESAYLTLLSSFPCGLLATMRVSTNYLSLKNVVNQRKHHRLPAWKEFETFVRTLPGMEEILRDDTR